MPDDQSPVEAFYSYAHADKHWLTKLDTHLSMLKRQGLISTWSDREIIGGTEWRHDLDTHLNRASVILLLISPDFLASDFCYGVEMKRALERHQAGEARVIPIIVRPVDWQSAPFAHLQALPTEAKPISTWSNLDTAFADVAAGIRRAIKDLSVLAVSLPQTDFPPIWNIPFARNPFFLGRDDLLTRLHTQLQRGQSTALSHPQRQAISGLGGIGKTQLAIEYAYRYRQGYQAVLWARAESRETLTSSYSELAVLLNLPEKEAKEQEVLIQAVKHWLHRHRGWLLILDNADEPDLVLPFLPPALGGHLLVTTRATALGPLAQRLEVETFSSEMGALFLLRRAGIIAPDAELGHAKPQDQELAVQLVQELGGLPLALDQAGAYLETTGCGLLAYQQLSQQRSADLLREYRGVRSEAEHPPVATTWSLSFARVKERNQTAAELLWFCAFLAADAIPEELFTPIAMDAYQFDQAIEALRAYSLIERDPASKTLTVHRLVQNVVRDALPVEAQHEWTQRVVLAISATFPYGRFENWSRCERLLPHALLCAQWIEQNAITVPEAARLLNLTAYYLGERGRYAGVEHLHTQGLAILEHQEEVKEKDIATSLAHLGYFYRNQGRYEEAEPLFQRALAIDKKVYGSEHPEVATDLNNLAALYHHQGIYREAEPLLQQSLSIRERALGAEHPDTARSLNNLGALYREQGKYAEAEPLLQRSLAARERVLGAEHPETAISLNNLGFLYESQGKYEEADPLYQRALAIYERALGPEHPDTKVARAKYQAFLQRTNERGHSYSPSPQEMGISTVSSEEADKQ